MNKVVLIGRLTRDPDLKFTSGKGTAVSTFTIAVDRRFSRDGQREADFVPIVVWGKPAESTANYMSKGKLIGISGRIQTRNYEAKDGTRRYVTEVIADEVQFLQWSDKSKKSNQQIDNSSHQANNSQEFHENSSEGNYENYGNYGDDITPVDDNDIPF